MVIKTMPQNKSLDLHFRRVSPLTVKPLPFHYTVLFTKKEPLCRDRSPRRGSFRISTLLAFRTG